jgi:hypothetical protein
MATNPPTTAERERVQARNLNDPLGYDSSPRASGVGVYDRPATTRPASNTFGTILAILVILILAYFVFQWLF